MLKEEYDNITPTDNELKKFAYSSQYKYVIQDWDICTVDYDQRNLYLDFALDSNCPKQDLFVHMLFVLVGSLVYDEISYKMTYDFDKEKITYHEPQKQRGSQLSKKVQVKILTIRDELKGIKNPKIQKLYKAIEEKIISEGRKFEYDYWFNMGWEKR